jgi:hypothetical protein
VIGHEHYDRTDDRDYHAVKVKARDALCAKGAKNETTDNSANNAEEDIEHGALALIVDDLAADEPSDETQDKPTDDRHELSPMHDATIATTSLVN